MRIFDWLFGKKESNPKPKKETTSKSKINDLVKYYYDNFQLQSEGNLKDDKKYGLWKFYHENGQLKNEGDYKTGKQHGFNNLYYENGQLKNEGDFKHGKPDGIWKTYYENGQLKNEINTDNGEVISQKCFDENGNETECEKE